MRKDSPLSGKKYITPQDLWDKPLMFNRNTRDDGLLTSWLRKPISELHIAATYNLLFNASLMVDEPRLEKISDISQSRREIS